MNDAHKSFLEVYQNNSSNLCLLKFTERVRLEGLDPQLLPLFLFLQSEILHHLFLVDNVVNIDRANFSNLTIPYRKVLSQISVRRNTRMVIINRFLDLISLLNGEKFYEVSRNSNVVVLNKLFPSYLTELAQYKKTADADIKTAGKGSKFISTPLAVPWCLMTPQKRFTVAAFMSNYWLLINFMMPAAQESRCVLLMEGGLSRYGIETSHRPNCKRRSEAERVERNIIGPIESYGLFKAEGVVGRDVVAKVTIADPLLYAHTFKESPQPATDSITAKIKKLREVASVNANDHRRKG